MGLFGKKKAENMATPCRCESACAGEAIKPAEEKKTLFSIKVLGSGCAKCKALDKAAQAALAELGIALSVEHVTDFSLIAAYGVMTTPALVVNGKVASCGKALNKTEVMTILRRAMSEIT